MTSQPVEAISTGTADAANAAAAAESDLLTTFELAGVLNAADVQVARVVGRLGGETEPAVLLAVALTVRAARCGSVCIDLAEQHLINPQLPWPEPASWQRAVVNSPVTGRISDQAAVGGAAYRDGEGLPLQFELGLLYLNRYRLQEADLTDDLVRRWALEQPLIPPDLLPALLSRLYARPAPELDGQRLAAEIAARTWTTFLTGGPGTGKTATIARILALLVAAQPGPVPRIALAAPTGKAAARLTEAIAEQIATMPTEDRERLQTLRGGVGGPLTATTIHRLLGVLPANNTRFRHHRRHHLPYDVVVVDECSMVSLTLLARLVEAVSDETRLVLVGDADQLSSVEAGAAFADLITAAQPGMVRLEHNWRFGSSIAELANAVRGGDADLALSLLAGPDPAIALRVRAAANETAGQVYRAAVAGDAEQALALMRDHRVLCAHRSGRWGIQEWNRRIERLLVAAGMPSPWDQFYPGRQLLIAENDYALGLFNGDAGVIVAESDGSPIAVFENGLRYRPARIRQVLTAFAITVHRSQGSQFGRITLVLPPPDSPLLSRELLYTAITRAQFGVEIVGTPGAFRAAVQRPAARASGFARRLAARSKVQAAEQGNAEIALTTEASAKSGVSNGDEIGA